MMWDVLEKCCFFFSVNKYEDMYRRMCWIHHCLQNHSHIFLSVSCSCVFRIATYWRSLKMRCCSRYRVVLWSFLSFFFSFLKIQLFWCHNWTYGRRYICVIRCLQLCVLSHPEQTSSSHVRMGVRGTRTTGRLREASWRHTQEEKVILRCCLMCLVLGFFVVCLSETTGFIRDLPSALRPCVRVVVQSRYSLSGSPVSRSSSSSSSDRDVGESEIPATWR